MQTPWIYQKPVIINVDYRPLYNKHLSLAVAHSEKSSKQLLKQI